MRHAPRIPCAKCGSSNTELRAFPHSPGCSGSRGAVSLLAELAFHLLDAGRERPPHGLRRVVCRDCGHAFLVHFN